MPPSHGILLSSTSAHRLPEVEGLYLIRYFSVNGIASASAVTAGRLPTLSMPNPAIQTSPEFGLDKEYPHSKPLGFHEMPSILAQDLPEAAFSSTTSQSFSMDQHFPSEGNPSPESPTDFWTDHEDCELLEALVRRREPRQSRQRGQYGADGTSEAFSSASRQSTQFLEPLLDLRTLIRLHASADPTKLPIQLRPHICRSCTSLRGIYIGETSNIRARFERHASNLAKPLGIKRDRSSIQSTGNDSSTPSSNHRPVLVGTTYTKNLVAMRVFQLREQAKAERSRLRAVFVPIAYAPSSTRLDRETLEYWLIRTALARPSVLLNEKGGVSRTPLESASLASRQSAFEKRRAADDQRNIERVARSLERAEARARNRDARS